MLVGLVVVFVSVFDSVVGLVMVLAQALVLEQEVVIVVLLIFIQ